MGDESATEDPSYTERLLRPEHVWWKALLPVQAPYRWNLRRLHPGFVLDVGCGTGRNLSHIDGRGVGVDHNLTSVEVARSRGLIAFTPEEFRASEYARDSRFDSLLLAHVAEHLSREDVVSLLHEYVAFVRPGGRVIIITPQEAGFGSDDTHIEFVDFPALEEIASAAGFSKEKSYSFPFPRSVGRVFPHNEFVWVGTVPDEQTTGSVRR